MDEEMAVFSQLHKDLSNDLDRIADRFTGDVKLSLIVRTSDTPDGSLYLTNDETEKVIAAIHQRDSKSKFVFEKEKP